MFLCAGNIHFGKLCIFYGKLMEELTLFLFILGTVVYVNVSLLQFPLSFCWHKGD
ncbi:hypothetical protein ACE6H2_019525 [Prunus campanulata]